MSTWWDNESFKISSNFSILVLMINFPILADNVNNLTKDLFGKIFLTKAQGLLKLINNVMFVFFMAVSRVRKKRGNFISTLLVFFLVCSTVSWFHHIFCG